MSHLFISYSKKNKAYARALADHLIASGFDVWIDDRIDYGSEWEEAIQKAIEECAAFIVIMTPDSRESKWVKRECQYAEALNKPAFPMLLAGKVFFRYGTAQYVDVSDGSLPPDAFLDELAEYAPRKVGVGADVTPLEVSAEKASASQLAPLRETPEEDGGSAEEAAQASSMQIAIPTTPPPDNSTAEEVRQPAKTRKIKRRRLTMPVIVVLAVVGVVGLFAYNFLFVSPVEAGFHYYYDPSDPLTVHFVNDSTGNLIWSYQWITRGADTETNPNMSFTYPGVYRVLLTAFGPGENDGRYEVNVPVGVAEQPPEGVSFRGRIVSGTTVAFTSYVIDPRVVTGYEWRFGDSTSSDEPNPTHDFEGWQTPAVSLTVTFADGEQVSAGRSMRLEDGIVIYAGEETRESQPLSQNVSDECALISPFPANQDFELYFDTGITEHIFCLDAGTDEIFAEHVEIQLGGLEGIDPVLELYHESNLSALLLSATDLNETTYNTVEMRTELEQAGRYFIRVSQANSVPTTGRVRFEISRF